jgi:hypothetical protein
MASVGPKADPVDISCADFLITAAPSFEAKSIFEESPAGLPAGGEAACLRASESLAAFRLRARIAAAAALLAAGFWVVRVGDSTALRAAAAGLAATRRETSMAAVFFAAAAGFPRAGFLPEARLAGLPETAFEFARADAPPVARASTGLAIRVAPFFAAPIVLLARGAARAAEAFFLAAGFAATGLFARRVTTAVFDFVLRENLLAASFLEASARPAAARLALSKGECCDTFALGVPGCFACFALFACFVLDDFMVFLTDAITSASFFLPRFGDETALDGGKNLSRSETLNFGPGEARSGMLLNDDRPSMTWPD